MVNAVEKKTSPNKRLPLSKFDLIHTHLWISINKTSATTNHIWSLMGRWILERKTILRGVLIVDKPISPWLRVIKLFFICASQDNVIFSIGSTRKTKRRNSELLFLVKHTGVGFRFFEFEWWIHISRIIIARKLSRIFFSSWDNKYVVYLENPAFDPVLFSIDCFVQVKVDFSFS